MGHGVRTFLEDVTLGLVGAQDSMTALVIVLVLLGFAGWRWHRSQRDKGRPGVELHHIVLVGLLAMSIGSIAVTAAYGWKLYKDAHPSPDPKTGIVGGPYSKPDVERLIGVFMSLDDVLTDKAENVFVINGTRWGSLSQPLQSAGADGFAAQIPQILGRINEATRALRGIANRNNSYGGEIEPAISDPNDASGQVVRRLNVLGNIIETTKGLDEKARQSISQHYVQDLDLQMVAYSNWIGATHANIAAKLSALRMYK